MKKILSSSLVVVGVAALAVGATGAYFSSSVSATNNNISSGTLGLTVNGSTAPTTVFKASNMSPGGASGWATAVGAGGAALKNTGTVAGTAWFTIENIKVTPNVNGDVSLADRIKPVISLNDVPYGVTYTSGVSVNALKGTPVNVGTINPGQTVDIYAYDLWPDAGVTLDNAAQGESLTYDVVFHLDQKQ